MEKRGGLMAGLSGFALQGGAPFDGAVRRRVQCVDAPSDSSEDEPRRPILMGDRFYFRALGVFRRAR